MVRSSTSRLASDPRFEQRLAFVRSSEPSTVDPALLETMVKSVVSSLDISSQRAEAGIASLKEAAERIGQQLQQRVEQGKALQTDLSYVIDLGGALADRLEGTKACSFQDITGQRITKVVKALRHIESKIDALLTVFGADHPSDTASVPETAAAGAQASLLNGPQLPEAANSQADIDALMASFD